MPVDLSQFAPGGPAGGSAPTPGQPAPAPASGGVDLSQFAPAGAQAPSSGGGGGLLHTLGHIAGDVVKPLGQGLALVSAPKIASGLYHTAGDIAQSVGISPEQMLEHVKGVDPFYHPSAATVQKTSSPAVNAIFGNPTNVPAQNGRPGIAKGEKGLHVLAAQAPALTGAGVGLEHTVAGAGQLPVAAAQAAAQRSLAPLQNSIYGKDIQKEGVLGFGLQTVGNAALLAGGVGAGLDALGAGDAAEAARLTQNAADIAARQGVEGGYESAAHADELAQQAAHAGQDTAAAEHATAAQNLSKAADLQGQVAEQSPTMQRLNQVRQGLNTFEHMGNQVAGAPVELYTKYIPGALDKILPGENAFSSAVSGAASKVANVAAKIPKVGEMMEKAPVRNLAQEGAAERARLAQPVKVAFTQAAKLTPEVDDQLATQLVRRGDVNVTTAPQLDAMSDEQLQAHIDRTGIDATPEAIRTAVEYVQNPDSHPEITQAKSLLDSVQAPADRRFAAGRGASQILGEPALAEREAKVAGEASPAGIAARQAKISDLLRQIEDERDAILQRNLEPQAGQLTDAQQRRLAQDAGTVKTLQQQVAKEEARSGRTATAHEAAATGVIGRDQARIANIAGGARESLQAAARTAAEDRLLNLQQRVVAGEKVDPLALQRAQEAVDAESPAPADRTKIQQQTNRRAAVANARTGGEAAATERLTAAEAARQARAESGARGALGNAQEATGARSERFRQQAAARAAAQDNARLAVLADRYARLQAMHDEVPNALRVQAPQVRTAVQSAAETRASLLQAAQEAHAAGDVAEGQRLAALAGKAAPTAADLQATGVSPTFLPGSEVPEKPVAGAGSRPRVSAVKKLGSERMRTGIGGPMDYESQQALYENNIAGQVRNEVNRRLLTGVAQPASAHVEDSSLAGRDLADELAAKDRVPVGLVHKGGVDTVDQLRDDEVTPDTPTMSKVQFEEYKKQFAPQQKPGALRTVENAGRLTKLIGPGFTLRKGLTDAVLNSTVGGVSLPEFAAHVPEALAQGREGTLPANLGAVGKPNLENAGTVDRALSKVAEKGMVGFRTADNINRGALYGALRDQGLSPLQAEARVQAVAGNIGEVNRQAGGLRSLLTYPGWQLHLAKVLASIPVEHLGGLLQSGAVANAATRSYNEAHPNQQPTMGGIEDALNPFSSMLGMGKGVPGEGALRNVSTRLGSMVAPLPEFVGNLLGVDVRKGSTDRLGQPFGQNTYGTQLLPQNVAGMFANTYLPQLAQVEDVAGRANTPAGYVPYRNTNTRPETTSTGVQVKPGSTKLGAIANLLGVPVAQKVTPAKKKG